MKYWLIKSVVILLVCKELLCLFAYLPKTKFETGPHQTLSEYGFFKGNIALQIPADSVTPYSLNTPLFSDYAQKLRFVKLPANTSVQYQAEGVLNFPVGSTLLKTFYYPLDFRKPQKGRKILETRLLIHKKDGWQALVYIWNAEQTEAYLEVAGSEKEVNFINNLGKNTTLNYSIPNLNQCKGCHNRAEKMMPIGPSVAQLNGDFDYNGTAQNQLIYWQKTGMLDNLPALNTCPKTPVWNDPSTGTLDSRARAYLDINCAHCHNPLGPANTSGLNLSFIEQNPTAIGIYKSPVAAGRGSGGRAYDIVAGKPDKSILLYRMQNQDPGIMMPEIGRTTAHAEGVELIKTWIKQMK